MGSICHDFGVRAKGDFMDHLAQVRKLKLRLNDCPRVHGDFISELRLEPCYLSCLYFQPVNIMESRIWLCITGYQPPLSTSADRESGFTLISLTNSYGITCM